MPMSALMNKRNLLVLSIILAICEGLLLARLLPYIRIHVALPGRDIAISAVYIACFGSLVLLRRVRSGDAVSRRNILMYVFASTFILVTVTAYESTDNMMTQLWIAMGALGLGLLVSTWHKA